MATTAPSAQRLVGPHQHACLLYDTDDQRLASLAALVREGIAEGERVLFLGEAVDILRRLRSDGTDPDAIRAFSTDEAYLPGGTFDPDALLARLDEEIKATTRAGYSALRIVGELSWVRAAVPGTDRLVEYERRLGVYLATADALAICQYDRRLLDAQTVLAATTVHSLVIQGANPRPAEARRELQIEEVAPTRFRLRGVVDISNVNLLARRVEGALEHGEDLEIDMRGLAFIDVAGLWVIHDAALRLGAQGKRVRLVSPPAPVEKVLEILGWDELDALEVARSRA